MQTYTHGEFVFDVTDSGPRTDPARTVVLLHGFPEDRHSWDRVTPALVAAGHRVLAPDLRGYPPGARPRARSAYRLSWLAADVLALADAAGAQRFHVVGHDWGAALAWFLAAEHPDRVTSMSALSVPHPMAFARPVLTGTQAFRSWYMAAFQLPGLPEAVLSARGGEMMRRGLVRTGLDGESAARYARRARRRADLRGPISWYRALPLNLARPVGAVTVPTLYVRGGADRFVTATAGRHCARYVGGPYRYEVLEDASHWLPEQAPDRIAALLIDHIARYAPTPESAEPRRA